MTEKLDHNPNQGETTAQTPEVAGYLPDEAHAERLRRGEKSPQRETKINVAEVRHKVHETVQTDEAQPNALEQLEAAEKAAEPAPQQMATQEDKQIKVNRQIQRVQRVLPAPQRLLSKVIHQPAVRVISEAAAKTVSRPSGMLGGGLLALIGSSGYLYVAKHIGFEYNYFVFLVLFFGGFMLGILLELGVHLATASRRRSD